MNKLTNLINKLTGKKEQKIMFTALMETPKGTRYKATTEAYILSEAVNKILTDSVEGCKIVEMSKVI